MNLNKHRSAECDVEIRCNAYDRTDGIGRLINSVNGRYDKTQ